jgi:hypothetical protein
LVPVGGKRLVSAERRLILASGLPALAIRCAEQNQTISVAFKDPCACRVTSRGADNLCESNIQSGSHHMTSTDPRDDQSRSAAEGRDSSEPWLSSAAEQVQRTAGATAGRIKDRAREAAEQQKEAGADQIGGVAEAMEAAAGELEQQMPMVAEYIEDVAGQLGSMASALRERSIDDMLGSAAGFARRQPGLFFAGAVAAGFALSRFAKSSGNQGSRGSRGS